MDLFTLVGKIAIDSTEAETKINTLLEKVGQLNNSLGGDTPTGSSTSTSTSTSTITTSGTSGTSSFLKSVLSVSIGNLSSQAVRSLVEAIKSAVKDGYQYNLDKESYIASLKTMMGSTWEEAEAFFAKLTSLSVSTPLNMNSIGEAATRFLALGYEPDDMVEKMLVLGNVARGDNDTFVRLSKAFTDVYGKMGLKAQEKNQFAETGVPILSLLADLYGSPYDTQEERNSFNELMINTMEKGGIISPDDVWNALKMSTEEGGLFYNAMSTAMQTTKGQQERRDESKDVFYGTLLEKAGVMDFMKTFFFTQGNTYQTATDLLEGDYVEQTKPKDFLSDLYDMFTDSFTDEEWEEELRQRQEDAGRLDPGAVGDLSSFQTTIDNWTSAFDMDGLKTAIAAAAKEGVTEGLSGVTITTGSVTLNDGVLVGRIAPRINLALGQQAARDLRG